MRTHAAPLRCAIYARFSSEMQSARSADDQIRECREFAAKQNPPWTIVLVERDEAVRASDVAGRTGYQRVVVAARAREIDVVLVEELSRFSRSFMGAFVGLAELRASGAQLADTRHGVVDTDSPAGQMTLAVEFMNNESEARRTGARSKRGLTGKVLAKYSGGGMAPYGYRRVAKWSETETDRDGRPKRVGVRFERDPFEAAIVARIFDMYASGATKTGIARRLNEEGIPTRKAGSTYDGKRVSGLWGAPGIKEILERPTYSGKYVWNRTSRRGEGIERSGKKKRVANVADDWITVDGFVEPIVAPDVHERVVARLAEDARQYAANHVSNERKRYLLSGLVQCAGCGAPFTIGLKSRGVSFYRCRTAHSGGCSNKVLVPREALEERVRRAFDVIAKDPNQLDALVAAHNAQVDAANHVQLEAIDGYRRQVRELELQRDRLIELIKTSPQSNLRERFLRDAEELEDRARRLRAQADEADAKIQPFLGLLSVGSGSGS
jgi:DNA invertase Pin-like site-specific DNA recombinase